MEGQLRHWRSWQLAYWEEARAKALRSFKKLSQRWTGLNGCPLWKKNSGRGVLQEGRDQAEGIMAEASQNLAGL